MAESNGPKVLPNILIVDDRVENLLALQSILEELPLQLRKASSGKEALWILLQYDFALVIIDVQMPEMDGFETVALMKERKRTKNIPIIFVTAIDKDEKHIFKGYEVGAVDYLFKPIDAAILKSKVLVFLELYNQRKLIENQANALQESEEIFRAISNSAQDGIIMVDSNCTISYWNKAAERIFRYQSYEVFGKKPDCVIPPRFQQEFVNRFELFKKTGTDQALGKISETHLLKNDGKEFPIELSVSSIKLKDNWCAVFMVRDITDRKKSQKHLDKLAYYDSLTGLPNRKMFLDTLNRSLALAKRNNYLVALLFLDLDGFKYINDTFGHDVGDILLKEVGERVQECIRESDFIGRLGGDEFTVVLTRIEREETAAIAAQRINKAFETPFHICGIEFSIGVSIGISLFPHDSNDARTLLVNADKAMYSSKKNDRNCFQIYSPAININAYSRLKKDNDLRNAFSRDEFLVYYHPIVDLNKWEITGVEALVRWRHSSLGLLPPDEFIPLAEETGVIVKIDEWVIRAASQQLQEWEKKGITNLRVAINISSRWFRHEGHTKIIEIVEETGIDPHLIELELTENTLLVDIEKTITMMHELKKRGIRISIDDFGTGYSSMAYIQRLPINALKVDQSFTFNSTKSDDDKAIVTAIINMAHIMRLKVVAEGVETKEHLELLRELNCEEIQGYLICKPLPAEDIVKLLEKPLPN
ncbi:MAG: EAL domain-containing protein [bacterium]